jgi:hypothetical protein
MKKLSAIILFISFSILFFSCSGDNEPASPLPAPLNGSTFKANNELFTVLSSNGINLVNQDYTSQNMVRSSFTIVGLQGISKSASVTFDLFRKPTVSIAGTYVINDVTDANSDDMESYVQTNNRACLGWTSFLNITELSTQNQNQASNPMTSATITIIDHGSNLYTIKYTGSYRKYNGFDVVGTIPVEVDITGTAIVH